MQVDLRQIGIHGARNIKMYTSQVDLKQVGIHDTRNIKNFKEIQRAGIYTPDPTRGSADLALQNIRDGL